MDDRLPTPPPEPPPGFESRIGHYEIVEQLGAGGMGIVLRARDVELGREVALKSCNAEECRDSKRRKRFNREARAASRLNHPHIVQIYEVFEYEDRPWIAMQLVEGSSLTQVLGQRGRLPVREILKYGQELAMALEHAHGKNVLHRDVSPGNVLISAEGHAQLTDFGLARFLEGEAGTSSRTTQSTVVSTEGMVMGTPPYRSPEQALGKPVDRRSDIFSLGAVIYEMCTGERAFSSSSTGDVTDAIVNRQPEPISRFTYEIPEELERIVRKCLNKREEERYQSATELQADLRALSRQLDYQFYIDTHRDLDGQRTRPRMLLTAAFVGVLAGGLLASLLWRFLLWPGPEFVSLGDPLQVANGVEWGGEYIFPDPVISPDGSRVAFTSSHRGNDDIYVVDVQGGEPLKITDHPGVDRDPAWFPDGSHLAFTSDRSGESAIWKIAALGGGATLLVKDAVEAAVSPKGDRIAFSRGASAGEYRIGVARLDDPGAVALLTTSSDGLWGHRRAVWSPDASRLVYTGHTGLWEVPADGGEARCLADDIGADLVSAPVWSSDGKSIFFSAERRGARAIWRVFPESGELTRITTGMGRESHPTVAGNGSSLAFATQAAQDALIVQDVDTGRRREILGMRAIGTLCLSPDGESVIFTSNRRSSRFELWSFSLRGMDGLEGPRLLLDHPGTVSHPEFSPDGKWIAYYRILQGERDLFLVPAEGGAPHRVTDHPAPDIHPSWSPDGTCLAFVSDRERSGGLWVVEVRDGEAVAEPRAIATNDVPVYAPRWSPDGREIAFSGGPFDDEDVWVVAVDEPGSLRQLTRGGRTSRVRWNSATGDLLVSGLWGESQVQLRTVRRDGDRLTRDECPLVLRGHHLSQVFDATPDGSVVAYLEEGSEGDIWVIRNEPGAF